MDMLKLSEHALAVALLGLVASWTSSAFAATAEERAKCEEMFKKMRSSAPHDHGADKTGAPGSMTAEHARCKQILGESAQGSDAYKSDKK
ncbi:MAG: hypothetical protein IKE66_10765 [Hyphomicrobium sp.]|nr:hypothetical protein [Hyphomicrobium sp.]